MIVSTDICNTPVKKNNTRHQYIYMLQLICNSNVRSYMKECIVCKVEFEAKRDTAKFCSPKCRVTHSRSVTLTSENVTLSEPTVTLKPPAFKFKVVQSKDPNKHVEGKERIREAIYWYDVPLAAVPVYQKDWPKMPEFMNGRQYFLWWKNEFKMSQKFPDTPEIHNPFPSTQELVYVKAGEGSRHWGTV